MFNDQYINKHQKYNHLKNKFTFILLNNAETESNEMEDLEIIKVLVEKQHNNSLGITLS